MTREEKLWTMTAKTLQEVGEKSGVKITNSDIKKGKAVIIKKILEAEAKAPAPKQEPAKPAKPVAKKEAKPQKEALDPAQEPKASAEAPKTAIKASETVKPNKTTKEPKRANLKLTELTYKGKTQSIKEWAAELNMPWPTLYDRVNRNGWPVDLAIETPLGQRRPKS